MEERPYSKFKQEEMILRDWLAVDRTILANERTFLAYIRTSLTLLVVGVSLIKFVTGITAIISGLVFNGLGILIFLFGTVRYFIMKNKIRHLTRIIS